jgi:isoamylase
LQDPVLATTKLIAEPWDIGPGGYQVGGFPPGWAEWNDKFRDTVRSYWKGDPGKQAEMATRLSASADCFARRGRKAWASVNFITAHDGFTLQDLAAYNEKHNEANGEDNRDGHDGNFSWNCGVEGDTEDAEIVALRDRQKRNFLATLLLSLGVPMILAGDEIGRSQRGNNNAYCQDNELSWIDWEGIRPEDEQLRDFVRYLVALRRNHRVFSRPRFFRGEAVSAAGLKDITWVVPEGREASADDWQNSFALSLGYVLGGAAGEFYTPGGQRDIDESFLVLMNAWHEDIDFTIPALPAEMEWELLVDTTIASGLAEVGQALRAGDVFKLQARSFALFVNRAEERSVRPGPTGVIRPDQPPATWPPVAPVVPQEVRPSDEETP